MELVDYEVTLRDGSTKVHAKCTRNAAASIALVCSESSYEQASLVLNRLAGFELSVMTEFHITNSVGLEFVKKPPTEIDSSTISEMNEKNRENVLKSRSMEMHHLCNNKKLKKFIQKMVKYGPDGILYKDYHGPTIKVMYISCDGTGVPGRPEELAQKKGKQSDGSAKTFEAKIGAVYIVEYTADGKPLLTESGEMYRDKKVKYMGTTRTAEDFGLMLYQHAVENGLGDMDCVVFLGDGARWIWGIQQKYFPHALTAIDLYHAIEHVNAMVDLIQFKGQTGSNKKKAFKEECIELLRCGNILDMLDQIKSKACKEGKKEKLETDMNYFSSNIERMNYGAFALCGIFVGSGVIEAGCKVIVANRMKNAGMHWSMDNAEIMIALRCAIRNDEFFHSYLPNKKVSKKRARFPSKTCAASACAA